MCELCEECLKIMYYNFCLLFICAHIVPLNITGIRGEPAVLEGDNLRLTCEALSQVEPNITWTKEKPGNHGNTGVVQEGKVLQD